jgi:hypothetical protein
MNKTSIAAILAAIASVSFVNAESAKQEVKEGTELSQDAASEKTAEEEKKTEEEAK